MGVVATLEDIVVGAFPDLHKSLKLILGTVTA